jgi:hypothetical protein
MLGSICSSNFGLFAPIKFFIMHKDKEQQVVYWDGTQWAIFGPKFWDQQSDAEVELQRIRDQDIRPSTIVLARSNTAARRIKALCEEFYTELDRKDGI